MAEITEPISVVLPTGIAGPLTFPLWLSPLSATFEPWLSFVPHWRPAEVIRLHRDGRGEEVWKPTALWALGGSWPVEHISKYVLICPSKQNPVTAGEGAVSHLNRMGKVYISYCNLRTKAFFPFPWRNFFLTQQLCLFQPETLKYQEYNAFFLSWWLLFNGKGCYSCI